MAKQGTEEELNIKRRARRRLIGAIALALAIVVILPMVLDSEPKPSGQGIELRIPAVDKAGEFVPEVAVSEVMEVNAESAVVVSAGFEVIAVAPVENPPVAPPVASGHITKQDVKKLPVATPEPEVLKAEVKQAEVKQAEVKQAEVKQAEAANYAVQVGAFSNAATATQEADKLKAWGFKAYTELISGTTRVRVGPYAERDKAEKVRLMLEKRGLHPVITALK
ncbi:MAG: SPOR domain-containing protein [Gallionella sp.]|nr:SPOR domain-containing protein [Gallionella sp.]MDP1940185.1 SPOR domain-containing protein [Gallionella sp.]